MAGEPVITVSGNLTGDPELRFTAASLPVANFTVAQTPQTYDKSTQQYVDDETLFVRCSAWRKTAENVAESLVKGQRVLVTGRLKSRSYEDKEGNNRTNWEMTVDDVGPSLFWDAVGPAQSQPGGGNQWQPPQQQTGWDTPQQPPQQAPPQQWGGQQPPQQAQQQPPLDPWGYSQQAQQAPQQYQQAPQQQQPPQQAQQAPPPFNN